MALVGIFTSLTTEGTPSPSQQKALDDVLTAAKACKKVIEDSTEAGVLSRVINASKLLDRFGRAKKNLDDALQRLLLVYSSANQEVKASVDDIRHDLGQVSSDVSGLLSQMASLVEAVSAGRAAINELRSQVAQMLDASSPKVYQVRERPPVLHAGAICRICRLNGR